MDERNRDRGTIKWTSLMLPQHVEMIKEVWKEDERIEKPILDEQQMEEIGFALQRALKDELTLEIQHYNGFGFIYTKVKVTSIDPNTSRVCCVDQSDKLTTSFDVNDIYNIVFI